MKRPLLFILLGALAVGSGWFTYRLRSQKPPESQAGNSETNLASVATTNPASTAKVSPKGGKPEDSNQKGGSKSADPTADPYRMNLEEALQKVRSGGEAGALRFDNPDLISVLQELDRRTADLNRRETELKRLSERIVAEQAALQSLTTRVASMQQKLDDSIRLRLDKIRQAERERREATGRKWAAFQPSEVVTLAIGLPPEETLAVLRTLPRETAARIVEALAKNGSTGARQLVEMMQQAVAAPEDRGSKP